MKGFIKILFLCSLVLLACIGTASAAMPADHDDGTVMEQSYGQCHISLHAQPMSTATLILAPAQDMPIVAPAPDTPEAASLLISKFELRTCLELGIYDSSKADRRHSIQSAITPCQLPRPPGKE